PLTTGDGVGDSDEQLARNFNNFEHFYRLAERHMDSALHWMDQLGTRLPLMRLSAAEESAEYRVAQAERWLSTQSLAVVATARNAMPGLDTTISNLLRLCGKFARCSLVFLENDSSDETRQRLHQLTSDLGSSGNSRVSATLLGCGRINSPEPCRLNVSYSTGKRHLPGPKLKRSLLEELERVQLMSALRNQLLAFAYSRLAANHSLLLALDPDLHWADWDLASVLQGLYFFHARPRLDS
uniref:SLC12 domain-containing protein n=1 Tax=Macrostomum lignano TaxID=282301 RepID=A0A1I8JDJ2_9PLAT